MRLIIILIISVFIALSCAGTNKRLRKSSNPITENVNPETGTENKPTAGTIKEVEEKVVPVDKKLPDTHDYFVIIGSFRNQDNAKKYQGQISKKGFNSTILRNESGLYRVSVFSTDAIEVARDDVRRIRGAFPEHYDTWLLIQMK